MTDETMKDGERAAFDFKTLVNRFLAWPLPKSVAADGCATNNAYPFPRSGTNLLNGEEAEAMLRYVLAEARAASPQSALSDEQIQALWDEACKDSPTKPGWCRHIRFARALLTKEPTERMSDAEDAARYRWLKMRSSIPDQQRIMLSTPWGQWDAAIDAARKAEIEGGEK